MGNYLRTLKTIDVFKSRSDKSPITKILAANQFRTIVSEKLRNGIIWFEIILHEKTTGFIKKDNESIFICKHCELNDDKLIGFNYKSKNSDKLSFYDIFNTSKVFDLNEIDFVKVERILQIDKGTKEHIEFQYNKKLVEVYPYILDKGDEFYIVNNKIEGASGLIEIDNFEGLKGVAPVSINYLEIKDKWETNFVIGFGIITIFIIILILLNAGLLVLSSFMIILGIIVGSIILYMFKFILRPLKFIFYQIKIRI